MVDFEVNSHHALKCNVGAIFSALVYFFIFCMVCTNWAQIAYVKMYKKVLYRTHGKNGYTKYYL